MLSLALSCSLLLFFLLPLTFSLLFFLFPSLTPPPSCSGESHILYAALQRNQKLCVQPARPWVCQQPCEWTWQQSVSHSGFKMTASMEPWERPCLPSLVINPTNPVQIPYLQILETVSSVRLSWNFYQEMEPLVFISLRDLCPSGLWSLRSKTIFKQGDSLTKQNTKPTNQHQQQQQKYQKDYFVNISFDYEYTWPMTRS